MTGSALASEPLTVMPRATMMRATAEMPTPPMPMKWTSAELVKRNCKLRLALTSFP